MEKFLGQEFEDLKEREQYLKDNADTIEAWATASLSQASKSRS